MATCGRGREKSNHTASKRGRRRINPNSAAEGNKRQNVHAPLGFLGSDTFTFRVKSKADFFDPQKRSFVKTDESHQLCLPLYSLFLLRLFLAFFASSRLRVRPRVDAKKNSCSEIALGIRFNCLFRIKCKEPLLYRKPDIAGAKIETHERISDIGSVIPPRDRHSGTRNSDCTDLSA